MSNYVVRFRRGHDAWLANDDPVKGFAISPYVTAVLGEVPTA